MKKLLFIGISYYQYTAEIINEFKSIGYDVTFYPIEPRTLYYKGIRTISKNIFKSVIDKYHQLLIPKFK